MVYEHHLLSNVSSPSSPSLDTSTPISSITPPSVIQAEQKAMSYETLAKEFYTAGKVELSKSYIARAIEIRKKIKEKWGDKNLMNDNELKMHQLTTMGKDQYEAAVKKYAKVNVEDEEMEMNGKGLKLSEWAFNTGEGIVSFNTVLF